jgi:hypothetical protein
MTPKPHILKWGKGAPRAALLQEGARVTQNHEGLLLTEDPGKVLVKSA